MFRRSFMKLTVMPMFGMFVVKTNKKQRYKWVESFRFSNGSGWQLWLDKDIVGAISYNNIARHSYFASVIQSDGYIGMNNRLTTLEDAKRWVEKYAINKGL